jgi:hypothetical protein
MKCHDQKTPAAHIYFKKEHEKEERAKMEKVEREF